MISGTEVVDTVRLQCRIKLGRMRILDGQAEAFEMSTASQYTEQDANTYNMHGLWKVHGW